VTSTGLHIARARRALLLGIVSALALGGLAAGCTEGTSRPRTDSGPGAVDGVDGGGSSAPDGSAPLTYPDGGPYDPFDPGSACGATAIPTERLPGSLLLVFDRSGSMNNPPGGGSSGPTMWTLSVDAINSVMESLSDDLGAGLLLFPGSASCGVNATPEVPVGPLSSTRAAIRSALSSASPSGGTTPLYEASRRGYRYLDTLDPRGQRGIVVVTDGGENCDDGNRRAFLAQVEEERTRNGYLTYAVGLTVSNNDLSTMAFNGGTPRSDTCLAQCTTAECYNDADCGGGGSTCVQPFGGGSIGGIPVPGMCGCTTSADCPSPLRCESVPFLGNQCSGTPNCCHYNATAGNFRTEFEAALADIARRFLESCVFELPRGTDPSSFDPSLVNVGVTFEGEDRTVLRRSSDESVDSWNYTTSEHRNVVIQGPICERLLSGAATVEIVLGCPTILI
jgi:hypothetical protein